MSHAVLVLEDGCVFHGISIGYREKAPTFALGEVVFNTSMTGYQEIMTDPSYANQMVTLTYPHIGNVGVNEFDDESPKPFASGVIIRQLPFLVSNHRAQDTLEHFLAKHNVVGIANIDTRRLTRKIRTQGALRGCIVAADSIDETLIDKALVKIKNLPSMQGKDLAREVTTQSAYEWTEGGYQSTPAPQTMHVVALDFGIKRSILRHLVDLGAKVTVLPATSSFEEVMAYQSDGVFLSNGPGDPQPCDYAITLIQKLLAVDVPLFGICLGYQLLALALGAKTYKMKFGHHGGNHPVKALNTEHVMVTSQNHGFAVDETTLPKDVHLTHRSLFDQTLQGFAHASKPAYGFQGHPEAGPGPNDAKSLFQPFIEMMAKRQVAHTQRAEI